ncbi:hypothetical protein WH52_06615 [Tenacibaculum holothuriorum]|uniref:DUF2141 domain-containing protein n=1 Tax=Tenacibaculum holothuriorum TaxID=1635173 RepID=A0A1Y2PF14_9FLAO|nr:hypothetical protein WH52_06615 [Tenacibaculum holothuriorum]
MLFTTTVLCAVGQDKHTITVNFSGMESDKGKLYVALYDSKETFLKKDFKGDIVSVKDKKATVVFKDIPSGVYAISAFHDENNNKKMDTRIFGIPKEPVGISNDAKGFMGPPKYKDAKFLVDKNIELAINVN